MQDIFKLTAVQIGTKLKDRELCEQEVLSAFYQKTEQEEPRLNAFVTLSKEEAFRKAEEVQRRREAGETLPLLAGVPIAVKDNISTKGIQTTCASKMLKDYIPPYHADVVERLERTGLLLFGKTNMDEFAMGSTNETSYFGPVTNPKKEDYVPGGSSGGSAAAVAAGECPIALGTDTGGSIRQPASFCGVTGLLPTYGSVSRFGLIAYASSFDQIGPIGKNAEDCAALYDVICGKDDRDHTSQNHPDREFHRAVLKSRNEAFLKGKIIGLPKECFSDGVDEEVKETVLSAAKVFEEYGAKLTEVSLSVLPLVVPSYYMLSTAEASSNLSRYDGVRFGYQSDHVTSVEELITQSRSEGLGEEVKKRLMLGTFVLSNGYFEDFYRRAQRMRERVAEGMQELFELCDVILLPTAPSTAPKKGESLNDCLTMYLSDSFTAGANLSGLPGISVPCGNDKKGLPIGFQMLSKKWSDKLLLCMADCYQQIMKKGRTL